MSDRFFGTVLLAIVSSAALAYVCFCIAMVVLAWMVISHA